MTIKMTGICKAFGDAKVLQDAQFSLESGEIHALMGENGAGKSTLMKILTGVYSRDAGEILVDGKKVGFSSPKEAENAGISFVYQELNSLLEMTVEENLFLGREIFNSFGVLDKKEMLRRSQALLDDLDVKIPLNAALRELSVGQRQMIEIAKALLSDAKTIILDEPTAALTEKEVETLFRIVRRLKSEKGVSFIYISHRMEEIFKLCDRITVLRDGKFIATSKVSEIDNAGLVKMMIGRELGDLFCKEQCEIGEVLLDVKNLSSKGLFRDVSFSVRAGEILGFAGLMGAGRTEIAKTIFGCYKADSGEISVCGKKISLKSHSPQNAMAHKIAYVTEDRKEEGLLLPKSIRENISLTNFKKIVGRKSILSSEKEKKLSASAVAEFDIRCAGDLHLCENLSGGNQQKVVVAKWLETEPKVFILDEPTRGVDIGAKSEIYGIIMNLAKRGCAVVVISSELPEILGISDRIAVVCEGRLAGILDRQDATQENIMTLATGN